MTALRGWENFYVIVGSSAGALIGLQFVVMTLIAGMPIIEVDKAKSVVVLKRGKGKGFSGLENPLFFKPVTGMLYGDAKTSLTNLVQAVQKV